MARILPYTSNCSVSEPNNEDDNEVEGIWNQALSCLKQLTNSSFLLFSTSSLTI